MDLDPNSFIPEVFLDRLREGHEKGRRVIAAHGVPDHWIEPCHISEAVESHRWSWRPERCRLVLVAESHVFTTLQDLARRYRNPTGAQHAPSNFVRLVYCLAYGEPSLSGVTERGTPQYWKLFGDLAGTAPRHLPGKYNHDRLAEKVKTLQRLSELGVWLLDASLHGIYVPKGPRIDAGSARLTAQLQVIWWQSYGQTIVKEVRPERIVAIGKGLRGNMNGVIPFSGWIYQPQGARNRDQMGHNAEVLHQLNGWLRGN